MTLCGNQFQVNIVDFDDGRVWLSTQAVTVVGNIPKEEDMTMMKHSEHVTSLVTPAARAGAFEAVVAEASRRHLVIHPVIAASYVEAALDAVLCVDGFPIDLDNLRAGGAGVDPQILALSVTILTNDLLQRL